MSAEQQNLERVIMGEVKEILILALIFSSIVIAVTSFTGDMFSTYGTTTTTNLALINKSVEIQNLTTSLQEQITDKAVQGGILTIFLEVGSGVFTAIQLLFNVPGIFASLLASMTESVSGGLIPGWFSVLVSGIVALIVLFKIVSAVMKHDI